MRRLDLSETKQSYWRNALKLSLMTSRGPCTPIFISRAMESFDITNHKDILKGRVASIPERLQRFARGSDFLESEDAFISVTIARNVGGRNSANS
jgi:hypothetical protein